MIRKTYALDGRALRHGRGRGNGTGIQAAQPDEVCRQGGAQGPVNSVFGESYSRGWSFYMNGRRYEPVKVNGMPTA